MSKNDTITGQRLKVMVEVYSPWVISNSRFRQLTDKKYQEWKTREGTVKVTYHEHSVVITWGQMGRQAISYLLEDK